MSNTIDQKARRRWATCAPLIQTALEHHRVGRLDRAETIYRKVLDKAPDHPDGLHMLGLIATAHGRCDRAIQLINRSLQIVPDFADAHLNLGNALRLAGRAQEAMESYRRAIALRPNNPMGHSNLARMLNDASQFGAALENCYAAIELDPRFLPARINLAIALKALGRLPGAVQAWRQVIALAPDRADSYYELGLLLGEMEEFEEALQCHDRSIDLRPGEAVFHCARGSTLVRKRDASAAGQSFRRAVELKSDFIEALTGLAWALDMTGHFDEAEQYFQRLRQLDPQNLASYRHLTVHGRSSDEAEEIGRLATLLAQPDTEIKQRIVAGFGLGLLLDNAGRYDDAFPRYAAANTLVREHWPANADRFDPAAFGRWVDLMIETYTKDYFAELAGSGNPSELPVFIVGMPRSGTTLVEQICASHSRVFGAGELHDVDRIALALGGGRDIMARQVALDAARQLSNLHIERLAGFDTKAIRVIDKMPDNVRQVGLVATLFPRARIIYCSRDARDISLSCYFQLFGGGLMHFAYDLADCGRRCRDIERVAAHWLSVLPNRMIALNYETLVEDLEGESRRLIEFLGLDWEPACLDFHRTERTVATASNWQVRQPLYRSSVGRWRNYERHLGPLLAALEPS